MKLLCKQLPPRIIISVPYKQFLPLKESLNCYISKLYIVVVIVYINDLLLATELLENNLGILNYLINIFN